MAGVTISTNNSTPVLSVFNGQVINFPVAVNGGKINLYQGGTINSALIGTSGVLDIYGGTANATEIAGGGAENIHGGASSQSNVVDRNGLLSVVSDGGGIASSSNNTIFGSEILAASTLGGQGGIDTGSTVTGPAGSIQISSGSIGNRESVTGGSQIKVIGGTLRGANVTGQGSNVSVSVDLFSGGFSGSASGVALSQGGSLTVNAGASATGNIVSQGGSLTVNSGGSVSNDTVGSGGTESVSGTEAAATIQGGTLTVQTGGTFQKVTFDDSGSPTTTGTLAIAGTASPTGTISKFGPTDAIDLQGLTYVQGGTATLGANDVLTVTENGRSMTLQLDPTQSYAGDYFALALAPDAGTGTTVKMMQASANPKESIALSAAEKHFAGQVSFNISAFDPTPFADMVSLIQNSPQAYFNAVHVEAKDPLLLAALADPSTGAAKRAEIGNAALQLASAIAGLGAGSALQTAAAITVGAIHQIEAGQVGMGFVNNALQNKAGTILVAENHVRPY